MIVIKAVNKLLLNIYIILGQFRLDLIKMLINNFILLKEYLVIDFILIKL